MQNKAFLKPDKLFSPNAPSLVPWNLINLSPPRLLPQYHGNAHLPSKDTPLLPSKTQIPQLKPIIPTKSTLFSPSHYLWNYFSIHNFVTFPWWSKANLLQPTNLHNFHYQMITKSNTTREGSVYKRALLQERDNKGFACGEKKKKNRGKKR